MQHSSAKLAAILVLPVPDVPEINMLLPLKKPFPSIISSSDGMPVDILSEESLSRVGVASVRDLFMRITTEDTILTLIDFPLRGELHDVLVLAKT